MTREYLIHLKTWFAGYAAGYYRYDPNNNRAIRLKEEHTERVCRNILMLGREINLSEQEMLIAETVALFHDVGRFKQYAEYGTFKDMASENHARLGIREMSLHRVLSACTKDEKRIVSRAIAYHNAVMLPSEGDVFMRLIRDADKLDIWKVVTNYYAERDRQRNVAIELDLPDTPVCSQNVIDLLNSRRFIRMRDLKTLDDFKLMQIGWAFDLNFAPSFRELKRLRYIEEIEATLPKSEAISEAVKKVMDYVESKCPHKTACKAVLLISTRD